MCVGGVACGWVGELVRVCQSVVCFVCESMAAAAATKQ